MLATIEDVAQFYLNAMEVGGETICLPWENFVDRRGSLEGLLKRLAPPVRFVLPEEEIDPEDIPYADKVVCYVDSDGEQVEVIVPVASPPHQRSYDAVLEHYAPAPRVRVRHWMLVIDSLKRHCSNLTKKLIARDREERRRGRRDFVDRETPVDISSGQDGPSLGLGLGSSTSTHQRHSDADRGPVPFTYAEPTRHSFGDSWAYWCEMDRMRQVQAFEMQRQFMAILQPYQYPSPQQGTYRPLVTLRISEQEPVIPRMEVDQDLERYRSRNRNKEPVVDITADDDSD
ncbi:hypothetical protein SOVF_111710 [Spinacia oleracea]|nr:hypothetical protein SOVF_111710 [Spinacia oleracea]